MRFFDVFALDVTIWTMTKSFKDYLANKMSKDNGKEKVKVV